MTEPLSGTPDAGTVLRTGELLVVQAPGAMPPSTWRTIEQDLLIRAAATVLDDGSVGVPAVSASLLVEILETWPGRRWRWNWTHSAQAAATRATVVRDSVVKLLSSHEPTEQEVSTLQRMLLASGFTRTLLDAQATAVTHLVSAGGGGNFSVPGSGKTTMTLAVYAALRTKRMVDRMLVVAPQSAYESWEEESRDCFDSGRQPQIEVVPRTPRRATEIVVINYERAAQGATRAAIDGWAKGRRLLLVFDEAHRAKRGSDGEHGRGAIDLNEFAEHRLVLTGTPIPNDVTDLEVILDLAWPGQGHFLASPHTVGGRQAWVRVTKDDLGLQPVDIQAEVLPLDENHQRIYRELAAGLLKNRSSEVLPPELLSRATARLIAAAANPTLLLDDEDGQHLRWVDALPSRDLPLTTLISRLGETVRPTKLLRAAALAAEHHARGEKLLIWSNFLGNIKELARLTAPLNPAVVTGRLPRLDHSASTDRVRELTRFREDPSCGVLIATPQTLGEGVSLHRVCQSQVHVDRTYNAGLFLQALDRTHRVGMPEGTSARVLVLIARGTVDELVHRSLSDKFLQMEEALRDPSLRQLAYPSIGSCSMDAVDVARLVAHLR